MPLIISGKEQVLWENETGDIRAIKIAFAGGEEKEVYKEGKCLYAMQLDFNHPENTKNTPLWMTTEYFLDEEEAIKSVKEQALELYHIIKAIDHIHEIISNKTKKTDKESDPTLN